MKHKHAELIIAWANGAKIQRRISKVTWIDSDQPGWYEDEEYRLKPEPKPDVVKYFSYINDRPCLYPSLMPNIKLIIDGETGKLKSAEVI